MTLDVVNPERSVLGHARLLFEFSLSGDRVEVLPQLHTSLRRTLFDHADGGEMGRDLVGPRSILGGNLPRQMFLNQLERTGMYWSPRGFGLVLPGPSQWIAGLPLLELAMLRRLAIADLGEDPLF